MGRDGDGIWNGTARGDADVQSRTAAHVKGERLTELATEGGATQHGVPVGSRRTERFFKLILYVELRKEISWQRHAPPDGKARRVLHTAANAGSRTRLTLF